MKRRKKRKGYATRKYALNQAYAKGLVFESVVQDLVNKAGFTKEGYLPQYNKKKTKLHGRGAPHQIDVMGTFRLGVPFTNPIFLVGEVKNFNRTVRIKEVRQFLGAYIDIIEFSRVNTKAPWDVRYNDILKPRVTYCPVFFSMKGFCHNAEALMFVHGIKYFSYENSEIMEKVRKLVEQFIGQIKFSTLMETDFPVFKDVKKFKELHAEAKKQDYDKVADKISSYLSRVNSYIGVLDKTYPIHILSLRMQNPRKQKEVKLILEGENSFVIKSLKNRQYGKFSLTPKFVQQYVRHARKNNYLNTVFMQIDVMLPYKDTLMLVHLKIENNSREELIRNLTSASS